MSKRIEIKITKAVRVDVKDAAESPLHMMTEGGTGAVGTETFHGAAALTKKADTFHGAAALTNKPDTFHGAAMMSADKDTFHGAARPQLHPLGIHGLFSLQLQKGQTVSRIDVRRDDDGDLTIIIHE